MHSHSAKSPAEALLAGYPKDGDISRWLTSSKYTRKGYAVVVKGQSPNNTRRLIMMRERK